MNLHLQSVDLLGGLPPASRANTAAATTDWIDIRGIIGDIRVIVDVGAVTGTITPAIQHATNGSGAGAENVTPIDGAFDAVDNTAPARQVRHVVSDHLHGWIRVVGTIVTGPALVAITIEGLKKYR